MKQVIFGIIQGQIKLILQLKDRKIFNGTLDGKNWLYKQQNELENFKKDFFDKINTYDSTENFLATLNNFKNTLMAIVRRHHIEQYQLLHSLHRDTIDKELSIKLELVGCYVLQEKGKTIFHKVPAPTVQELTTLTQKISERIARYLERQGLLVRDMDNSYLNYDNLAEDALGQIQGNSITYRIAVGPQAGQKVFTLQTLPAQAPMEEGKSKVAKVAGFSLHAGVASKLKKIGYFRIPGETCNLS